MLILLTAEWDGVAEYRKEKAVMGIHRVLNLSTGTCMYDHAGARAIATPIRHWRPLALPVRCVLPCCVSIQDQQRTMADSASSNGAIIYGSLENTIGRADAKEVWSSLNLLCSLPRVSRSQ